MDPLLTGRSIGFLVTGVVTLVAHLIQHHLYLNGINANIAKAWSSEVEDIKKELASKKGKTPNGMIDAHARLHISDSKYSKLRSSVQSNFNAGITFAASAILAGVYYALQSESGAVQYIAGVIMIAALINFFTTFLQLSRWNTKYAGEFKGHTSCATEQS